MKFYALKTARTSSDHYQWIKHYNRMYDRLVDELNSCNIVILAPDTLISNIKLRNASVVFLQFGTIVYNGTFLNDLEQLAPVQNLKFTIITDVLYKNDPSTNNVRIVFAREFLGVYYNPYINIKNTQYKRLYNFLIQRVEISRLHQFAELFRNGLIGQGYVSLIGWNGEFPRISKADSVKMHNKNSGNLYDDVINKIEVPFANFTEPDSLYELEANSKYSIVFETCNNNNDAECCLFTEKTIRSLQVNNISIIENKIGAIDLLIATGLKVHPINHILDQMVDYDAQIKFIIALLKYDILNDDMFEMSIHNQKLLESWLKKLQTPEFYKQIVSQVL